MNLMDLLRAAGADGETGVDAIARRFGVDRDQAEQAAGEMLPALSAGLRARAQSPDGLAAIASRMQANDAADAFARPDDAADTADAQGAAFLDQIFGGARGDVEQHVAERASAKSGLDLSQIQAMLPMLSGMLLGGLQRRESDDSALSGMLSALSGGGASAGQDQSAGGGLGGGLGGMIGAAMGALGGGGGGASDASAGPAGGGGMSVLTSLFDADGDGSAIDDIMGRFAGR